MKSFAIIDTYSIVTIISVPSYQSALAYCRDNDIRPVAIREQLKF